jgi:hypothetical protein
MTNPTERVEASEPGPQQLGSPPQPSDGDRDQVLRAQSGAKELEASEGSDPLKGGSVATPEVPGLRLLSGMMQATIFTDYFCYHAHLLHLHPTSQERVEAHKEAHPHFYTFCRNLDLVARVALFGIVTVALCAVACGFIWRTFFLVA